MDRNTVKFARIIGSFFIIQRVILRDLSRGMKRLWKIMSAEPTLLIKNPPRYPDLVGIGFILLSLALGIGRAQATTVSLPPLSYRLTVDQPILHTNDVDLQTTRLTILANTPDDITEVRLWVNQNTDHPRGFFQWTEAKGFRELGTTANGNLFVRLHADQSERIVDESGHKLIFLFRWSASPAYGDIIDNDISVFIRTASGARLGWQKVETNFSVVAVPSLYSSFQSLTVDKPVVLNDGNDLQTASLTLNIGSESAIDNVKIIVNQSTTTPRGYFQWTPTRGCRKASQFRNLVITFVTSTCGYSINIEEGTATYVFQWKTLPAAGETQDNTVYALFEESSHGHVVGWVTSPDAQFDIIDPPPPPPIPYLNHILSTGEDLSNGVLGLPVLTTVQPYTNLMLASGALAPLRETTRERMSSAMGNFITGNVPAVHDYQIVVTRHGESGAHAYSTLRKGTTPYQNGMDQVAATMALAPSIGKPYRVVAVTTVHGETDHVRGRAGLYEANLVEWQRDYEADIKALTGQTEHIPLFMDQLSSWTGMNSATSGIPLAQLAAAENNPGNIILVGPKYFLPYADDTRLNGYGYRWLGEYYGKVIKRVVVDGQPWVPLSPRTITRTNNMIIAVFNVPMPPLVFDTGRVLAQINNGFEYWNPNDLATTIAGVALTAPDTITITLNQTPTNASEERLRYAFTGTPGAKPGDSGSARGNLRDSDSTASQYATSSPLGYTLYNWAVTFDKSIESD